MSNALPDLTPAQQKAFAEWLDARKARRETYRLWLEVGHAFVTAGKTLAIARLNCQEENIPDECYVALHQGEL
jgi:hypothetical protein